MKYILFLTFLLSAPAYAGLLYSFPNKNQLPVSRELKRDVQFWEDIFGRYESDQCVYHDSKHLDVVYLVGKVAVSSRRKMNWQMRQQKADIRQALHNLSKGRSPRTWLERRVRESTPSRLRTQRNYRLAKERIRCQRGVATDFRKGLKRSKQYLPMIRKRLERMNLPADLAYLPHLESGFNNRAHSKVGARGLWQLMPETARQFIKVNRRRDDRTNPYLATSVAARILKDNYRKTKSWPLAITGYNYGINGVVRAIKKYGTSDYDVIRRRHKTRIFGFAAKNFYPSFVAVRNVAKRYEKTGRLYEGQAVAYRDRRERSSRN